MEILTLSPKSLNFALNISKNNYSGIHTHDFFEFIIVQSGKIEHLAEGAETMLTPGDIMMLAPGISHSYRSKQSTSHYDILVRDSFFKDICNYLMPDLYDTILRCRWNKIHISLEDIISLENHIYDWQETIDIKTKKSLEKIIVTLLISYILPQKDNKQKHSSFKETCLKAMNQYYSLPDALTLIRNELGYNEIYLCRKFKECFGCTLVEYVNNLRLSYASYLLQTMSIPISECVSLVGLNSLPYFTKIFKQKFGVTPFQYKKKHSAHS